jgi:hypothetical protein
MKIRGRIAAVGGSAPFPRYVVATRRRRIVASLASAALDPVRSGNADNTITARSAATRARILAETGEVIVRRGVEATAIDGNARRAKLANQFSTNPV